MSLIPMPVAIGLFLVVMIVNRIINERALRKLSTEEKGTLVEAFSGFRMIALVPLAAIAALYLVMTQLGATTTVMLLAVYLPAMVIFTVVLQWMVYRRLKSMDLPAEFTRAYVIGRGMVTVALGVVFLGF